MGESGLGVYLDFADAIKRLGAQTIRERYGNLFEMYQRITDENPYEAPMRIYPAVHYTMGGLWVDYNLMSTIPGLHVIGEANFSDHGANRLGASALMQGLADGYFVLPDTIGDYLASTKLAEGRCQSPRVPTGRGRGRGVHPPKLLDIKGKRTVDSFHRELGKIMWDYCGMARNAAGLKKALELIPELRAEFWRDVNVPGSDDELNQALEKAGRVADFLELGELMCLRRAAPRGIVRRPFPGGESDRRRRGAARRRALRLRRGLGVQGTGPAAGAQQGAAGVRERAAGAAELQVNEPHPASLAPGGPAARDGWSSTTPGTSARTCRSSRCWTWSTSA